MRELSSADEAFKRSRTMSPGWLLFDPEWLDDSGVRSVAQGTSMDLPEDFLVSYVDALCGAQQRRVLVVTHDQTLPGQFGFEVDVTVPDIERALARIYGLPFILMPSETQTPAVLVTDSDYRIIAGSEADLNSMFGSLVSARSLFASEAWDTDPYAAQLLQNALRTMDWISQ
jgi:hypothetical protein